ncbi:MAG: hypothetical protein P8K80_00870 [Phycisphaerales bacterium]|nr:hypothetical protein [Phycisphaerales bacterium]
MNPTSAIILLSDGRSAQPVPRGFTTNLRSRGIPIYSILLGSDGSGVDVGIQSTRSPGFAFIGDKVPIVVELEHNFDPSQQQGGEIILRSRDTGEDMDRVPIEIDQTEYTLVGEPQFQGDAHWIVEIVPSGEDLVSMNNTRDLQIELTDQPLRVLYVEGHPRWEYRYLKNLLIREQSIESSIMLLSADKDYAQEGNRPITRLPSTRREFLDFDVIIIGDLPASTLSSEQQEIIDDLVVEGELGIAWVGGSKWTPAKWDSTTLSNTLPFKASIQPKQFTQPVHMKPTDEALRLGVLQFGDQEEDPWEEVLSNKGVPWSAFHWMQRIEPESLKPTAQVLASVVESDSNPSSDHPILLAMRYGAGRSIYVATDEIWRWRHGRGERLYEQFWIQIIRSLARNGMNQLDTGVRLDISPPLVEVGEPQRIRVDIFDESILSTAGDIIQVEVTTPFGGVDQLELLREGSNNNTWSATWIPMTAGRLTMDPLLPTHGEGTARESTIIDPAGEMANPATHHELLRELAAETGGAVIQPGDLDTLPTLIPDRSITTIHTQQQTIWDNIWLLLVPIALLGLEWSGRRVFRLA